MISNLRYKIKRFHYSPLSIRHFTFIWLLFLFIFVNFNFPKAKVIIPEQKPSIFDLTGEKFFIPVLEKPDLNLAGIESTEYVNFYKYFSNNIQPTKDEYGYDIVPEQYKKFDSELLNKIITWYHLRSPNTNPNINEMHQFIKNNQDWPDIEIIRKKIEKIFFKKVHDIDFMSNYFDSYPPLSGDGMLAFSIIKFELGQYKLAKIYYDKAWHKMKISQESKDIFIKYCEICISEKDQILRFNRMLYLGDLEELQNTASQLSNQYQLLANIAYKLNNNQRISNQDFSKIEPNIGSNSSFHYLKIKWLVDRGSSKNAYEYFNKYKNTLNISNPILWAVESEKLGRRLIYEKKYREAYEVMTIDQKLDNQIFANLEFLKGWIALKIFGDNPRAIGHFSSFSQLSNSDEDKSSALYWTAKSYEANDKKNEFAEYLIEASKFSNTYYGLLSISEIEKYEIKNISPDKSGFTQGYENNIDSEQLFAIDLLCAVNKKYFAAKFIYNINEKSKDLIDPNILIRIANSKHLPQTSLRIAKELNINSIALEYLYPTIDFPVEIHPENKGYEIRDLLYSVVRQESEFSSEAVSYSGAVGLMQIMPNTARMLSRLEKIDYNEEQLLEDTHYNIQLGTRYLLDLITKFKGSYIYAISSYNAGPTRVKSWIRNNPDIEMIDWIELIPYRETRNYVKSVLRNRYYYKILLYTDDNNTKFFLI